MEIAFVFPVNVCEAGMLEMLGRDKCRGGTCVLPSLGINTQLACTGFSHFTVDPVPRTSSYRGWYPGLLKKDPRYKIT